MKNLIIGNKIWFTKRHFCNLGVEIYTENCLLAYFQGFSSKRSL
jgi:hypothetical protein